MVTLHLSERLAAPSQLLDEARSPQEAAAPSIKFVSWEHVAENNLLAAEAVRDCDVVAIEMIGFRNDRQRARYDAAATTMVSSAASELEKTKAQRYVRSHSPLDASLLQLLPDSDKRIVTIDINRGALDRSTAKCFRLLGRAVLAVPRLPNAAIKEKLCSAALGVALTSRDREAVVTDQLQDLVAQYEDTGVKIGVLAGSIHTPILHELTRLYPVEHRFAKQAVQGQSSREREYYPPFLQMARHYRFLPGVDPPESMVNRALLDCVQTAADLEGIAASTFSRARRVENMTDSDVAETELALDGIKRGLISRSWPLRTLAKMDRLIEARIKS